MDKIRIDTDSLAELRGQVVDIFEDFCDDNGIEVANEDREEYNNEAGYALGENDVKIFGEDYDRVAGNTENLIESDPGFPIPTEQGLDVIKDTVMDFMEILADRGSRNITRDESHALEQEMLQLYRNWGIIR